ncbi:MAG TPA: GTP diphosphokinase [Gammaproteobacteria bacterium]|nr:GTP diphosphokinase [Gammaproteobacteria bacterium]
MVTNKRNNSRAPLCDVQAWLASISEGLSAEQAELVRRALQRVTIAHGQQQSLSGAARVRHCMAVAEILSELHMDAGTLAAALLHDIEDTQYTQRELQAEFGVGVARLVGGASKLDVIQEVRRARDERRPQRDQAENLRKMLLAMAEDVRVVLIKLADRLHNMRTLSHLPMDEQRRTARETLDIFAPLANRLGIWQLKWELEDLALRCLRPQAYRDIARSLDERRSDRERYIARVVDCASQALREAGIEAEVKGRPKHIYSIWRKMQRKGAHFDEIFDVRAVRVLVPAVADCYAALGAIHSVWRHIPKQFDDYIANPKENQYQSLHTAVVGPEGKVLEVQIRTREMDRHAELGVAAHWRYKEGVRDDQALAQRIAWLRQLFEWKEDNSEAGDFIDRFRSEVLEDRVYVLTPRGRVVCLPLGATPLDFAYHVHTEIGHRCRGAKADGRIVPLTYALGNGQQVEVLTTRQPAPSRDWLNPELGYLKTPRARSKVRQWFKQQNRDLNIAAGRGVVERELHRTGLSDVGLDKLAQRLKFRSTDDFLAAVGAGDITGTQIASAAYALRKPPEPALQRARQRGRPASAQGLRADDVTVAGVGNLLTRLARCCCPVPGDAIVGFITRGRGVTVHRLDCTSILRLPEAKHDRLVDVEWGSRASGRYSVDVVVEAYDRFGLLRDIATVLAAEHINVLALPLTHNSRWTSSSSPSTVAAWSHRAKSSGA